MSFKIVATVMIAAFSVAKPVKGVEVSCQYDEKSEWPWVDSRVCQVEEKPLVLDDNGSPICSDARADKDGDGWGWENNQSCVIDLTLPKQSSSVPGLDVEQDDLVVFEQDFESGSVGPYLPEHLNEQWDTPLWHMGLVEGRAQLVQDAENGKALQVLFPANQYGSQGAVAFLTDLSFGANYERSFEELYISYDVKFSENFEFVRGGKLPGLCGYNTTLEPKDGCNTGGGFPSGYDGWSARGMWREDGVLENYMYHADQFYEYGDDEVWDVTPQRGQWHTIQHRVVLNTVGEANGIVEAWFDGVKVLSTNTMLYRKSADIGINLFYFSTFYGGADPSWAPGSDQVMYYDNFRIATTPLVASALSVETASPEDTPAPTPASGNDLLPNVPEVNSTTSGGGSVAPPVSADLSEPEISAANDLDTGGGTFFVWWLCALIMMRRKVCCHEH